jgi:ABC-type polysaccharide/polyol phosphate transport system ATPase subunit
MTATVIQSEGLGKPYKRGVASLSGLLCDSHLAVGDIKFQKTNLAKWAMSRAGRAIILVSHQLSQIRRLWHRPTGIADGLRHQRFHDRRQR